MNKHLMHLMLKSIPNTVPDDLFVSCGTFVYGCET